MALKYVGRTPDSAAIIVSKSHADSLGTARVVDADYVNAQISTQITNNLQTPSYVDTQDALRATLVQVDAADADYVNASLLNAPNGVAGLDASGNLLSAQIPSSIVTDRVFEVVTGTNILGPSATHTCTTTNYRETALSTLTVSDPGYPWRPLPFAVCWGASVNGSVPDTRTNGNGIYGLLAAVPPSGVSDIVYGATVCTADPKYNLYFMFPYALTEQTPANTPPITGSLELNLYGSCFIGSGYTFKGLNLSYWCLVVPAVGG